MLSLCTWPLGLLWSRKLGTMSQSPQHVPGSMGFSRAENSHQWKSGPHRWDGLRMKMP